MDTKVKSVFGIYAENMQVMIDEHQSTLKEPFYPKYFTTGTPKTGLTFSTAIGRARIEAAAAVIEHGSEAPLRSRPGFERLDGKVPAIAVKRAMDEEEYRNLWALQNFPLADESRKTQLLNLIWNDIVNVAEAVRSRVDIFAKQALSQGKVIINATTNPDGAAFMDVDLLVKHKKSLRDVESGHSSADYYWTGEGDTVGTATPINDIKTIVEDMEDKGIEYEKILMTSKKFRGVTKIKEVTDLFDKKEPTLDELNNYLSDRGLPYIEIVKGKHALEVDGVPSTYTAWDDKYVTFIPAGMVGTVHNAYALEEFEPVPNVSYALADRILVSKWKQTEPFNEFTRAQWAAFPALEVADFMFMLNTEKHTVGF